MAPPTVCHEWLLLLVSAAACAQLCFGQEDQRERTEDGKVRGPNSKLAKRAELLMPIIMGFLIVAIVFGFFFVKIRAAIRKLREEESNANDVEMAYKAEDLSKSKVERITRPVVWDKNKAAWEKGSTVSSATSVASSSSQDEMQAPTATVAEVEPEARGDRAPRQASKLPRDSADGAEGKEAGSQQEREGGGGRGSSKSGRRGSSRQGRRHVVPAPQNTDEIVFVHQ